jgi:hypothetical protein
LSSDSTKGTYHGDGEEARYRETEQRAHSQSSPDGWWRTGRGHVLDSSDKGKPTPAQAEIEAKYRKGVRMKRMDRRLNSWGLDKRTTQYHTVAAWRNEIIVAMGGLDELSLRQLVIVDLVMSTKMLMDRLDAERGTQEPILKGRHIIGYTRVRQQLDDALDRYMGLLGLKPSVVFFVPDPATARVSAPSRRRLLRALCVDKIASRQLGRAWL